MKIITTAILTLIGSFAFACDVCRSQQPSLFREFTHGTGPGSKLEFIIIVIAAIIVLIALVLSIKLLIKPGEKKVNHIKNIVVNQSSET